MAVRDAKGRFVKGQVAYNKGVPMEDVKRLKIKITCRRKAEERFWLKVDKKGIDECWNWKGPTVGCYGRVYIDNKAKKANRVAYELTYGVIPIGRFVCHKCDNTLCCNPKHLFLGTHTDNMQDMVKKNRQARGERQGAAKLTEPQVREIKKRYKRGDISFTTLGKEYGVNRTIISDIVHSRSWRHVK